MHQKETFRPIKKDEVTMYSCGPTVYDHAHIGNLRSYIFADTLQRVLSYVEGYKVRWVMNITDVEDRVIERLHRDYKTDQPNNGLTKLADRYTDAFTHDIEKVGIKRTDITKLPRATDHIREMQKLIRQLLDDGVAYTLDGSVYFSLEKYQKSGHRYGLLAKVDFKAQARITDDQDQKEGMADFVLWKAKKPNEPSWDFAIDGKNYPGRPGWHIECSVMSTKYLGQPFDIHTGGVDLIFPHHENEIAQSGGELAHYFVHNEHLLVEGKKMSKSLNNFYTLADVKDAIAFRYLCLMTHYRSKMDFSFGALKSAHNRIEALKKFAARLQYNVLPTNDKQAQKFKTAFTKTLEDDINTPKALAALADLENSGTLSRASLKLLVWADQILGLSLVTPIKPFDKEETELLEKRQAVRKDHDFDASDKFRTELNRRGITIEDTTSGQLAYRTK